MANAFLDRLAKSIVEQPQWTAAPDKLRLDRTRTATASPVTAIKRHACTGSVLPFSRNGSIAWRLTASRTSATVSFPRRISPGEAAASSRAATLTESPVTMR